MKRIKITSFMEVEYLNIKDEDCEKCIDLIYEYENGTIDFRGSLYEYLKENDIEWEDDCDYDYWFECDTERRI